MPPSRGVPLPRVRMRYGWHGLHVDVLFGHARGACRRGEGRGAGGGGEGCGGVGADEGFEGMDAVEGGVEGGCGGGVSVVVGDRWGWG